MNYAMSWFHNVLTYDEEGIEIFEQLFSIEKFNLNQNKKLL